MSSASSLRRAPIIAGRVHCGAKKEPVSWEECLDCRLRLGLARDEHGRRVVICAGDSPGSLEARQTPRTQLASDPAADAEWLEHVR